MTKEERRAMYIAKREAKKAAFEASQKWFDYKMHLCCSEDFTVIEGCYEYIVYLVHGSKKYHVDLINGMKFTCTEYKEIFEIIENFA